MKVKELPSSIHSRLRLGLTVIITLIVISLTTTVMQSNSAQVLAYSRVIENNNSHSTLQMPEKQSQSSTPTIQGPLQIPRTLQSNDLVNSLAFYEVTFITSTTGAIDKIRMDFPAGTNVAAAGVIERIGIGGGTLLKSGSSLTFDVTAPVSVPAGTFIRLEMFGIQNPSLPSNSLTATITTRDSGGNLIDGPSATNVYKMKRIGTNELGVGAVTSQKLADNSITSTKPAESFMKKGTLPDTPAGNALGWNPDGVTTSFTITESAVFNCCDSFISVEVTDGAVLTNRFCDTVDGDSGFFIIICSTAPSELSLLNYIVFNLPSHFP